MAGREQRVVAASCGSGAAPSSTPSIAAASATLRAIGPAVSWSSVTGTMPHRLTRPTVGLIAASIAADAGPTIDTVVSVPTFAAHRLSAVPLPDEELPVGSTGRPSSSPGRGSRRGSYGLNAYPPSDE